MEEEEEKEEKEEKEERKERPKGQKRPRRERSPSASPISNVPTGRFAAANQPAAAVKKPSLIPTKGLTDPIFIAVPTLDHLLLYNTIRGKLKRRNIVDVNEAWKTAIKSHFKVSALKYTSVIPHIHALYTRYSPRVYHRYTTCVPGHR